MQVLPILAAMHWDDLRVVRAVYRTGSYARAARELGVNETTVPRRLARLEKDLGVSLFEAVDGVRRPTARCDEIVALSETIAQQAEKISSIGLEGATTIERRRVTTTDSIAACLLAPRLADFLLRHPAIALDFAVSTENLDFSRWEADIAIRLKRPEKGDFVVSKLMDFDLFLIEPKENTAGRDDGIVCAYPKELDATPESRFLAGKGLRERARLSSKNLLMLKPLIQSGKCTGVLPGYMCADIVADQNLRFTQLPERRGAWLLVQRHLRNDPTTRTVLDWIRSCAASSRTALK